MALPLLPSSVVLKCFEDLYKGVLLTSSSPLDSLKPLFEYYENYWVKTIVFKDGTFMVFVLKRTTMLKVYVVLISLSKFLYLTNVFRFS